MGFGGEAGGGVNLINNKFPSAPQSHALCLIALYWFFSLSFFSFLGRALLSFWNNQVAKVDLGVECHLFSLLPLLPLLHPLIPPPSSSPFPWCLFCFTLSAASQLSRLSPNDFEHFPAVCEGVLINTRDCIHSRKWSFYSQAYCVLHTLDDGPKRERIRLQDLKMEDNNSLRLCAVEVECTAVLCKPH